MIASALLAANVLISNFLKRFQICKKADLSFFFLIRSLHSNTNRSKLGKICYFISYMPDQRVLNSLMFRKTLRKRDLFNRINAHRNANPDCFRSCAAIVSSVLAEGRDSHFNEKLFHADTVLLNLIHEKSSW